MNAPRQGFPLLAKENKACIHIPQVEVREELLEQSWHQRQSFFHLPIFLRLIHFLLPTPFPHPSPRKKKERGECGCGDGVCIYFTKINHHLQAILRLDPFEQRVRLMDECPGDSSVSASPRGPPWRPRRAALPTPVLQLPSFAATVYSAVYLSAERQDTGKGDSLSARSWRQSLVQS